MIDPSDSSGSLLSAADVPNLVYLAPLTEGASEAPSVVTVNSNGSYGSSYNNSTNDHELQFVGSAYTDYSDPTTYTGTTTFTIGDVSEMSQATLASISGSDMNASVTINGVTIFSDAPGGGPIYKCGQSVTSGYYTGPQLSTGNEASGYEWDCGGGIAYLSDYTIDPYTDEVTSQFYAPYWAAGYGIAMYSDMHGNVGTLNWNILPYLHTGVNTVSFNAVIGGFGWSGGGNWNIQFHLVDACGGP
jgi:hypothetical protein